MNEYEIILEALQYQVDCGELTLEEAELVNECAYDRYVSEGNAYNKLVNNRYREFKDLEKEHDKLNDKWYALQRLNHNYDKDSKQYKNIKNKMNDISTKSKDLEEYLNSDPKFNVDDKHDAVDIALKQRKINRRGKHLDDFGEDRVNELRKIKKDWMKNHGDVGQRPEERYKAKRYLNAHTGK